MQDIGMEFDVEKCAMLMKKSGKRQITKWTEWQNQERKRTRHLLNFIVPVNHRVKIQESKKIDKYFDLTKEPTKM